MKCHYAVDRETVQQIKNEFDENGNHLFQQVIEHNTASFTECVQEECGAWQNRRCRYGCAEK